MLHYALTDPVAAGPRKKLWKTIALNIQSLQLIQVTNMSCVGMQTCYLTFTAGSEFRQ